MSEKSTKVVEESYKELAPMSDRERSEKLRMSLIVDFIFPEAGENMYGLRSEEISTLRDTWTRNGIEIRRHDLADSIPFLDGSFDLVVCNAVLEHVHGIHKHIFSEARRVLKAGG